MKIDHMAMYVKDLEAARAFFETYFGAAANAKYRNPSSGLETYFLTFGRGARLEIMRRPGLAPAVEGPRQGYAHLAFQVDGREGVDSLTARLKADGYTVLSGPRETGDGYYESCVLDAEGNSIEIVG
ncbi:MAG: VOC family protein [Candidatus Pelethousia sp.]|nr:VOC family protein [Candidatus Pelethousia sp.]